MKLRVLVTGSRDWPEERADALWTDLTALLRTDGLDILTVVHGRCPTGIDRYTAQWCEAWVPMAGFLGRDVIEEPHPAAWNIHGKAAGPLRNQEMVDLGADVCLGYPI